MDDYFSVLTRELLDSNTNDQQELFTNKETELSDLLEEVKTLILERRLYRTWMERIDGKDRKLSVPNAGFATFVKEYLVPFIQKSKVHEVCHGGEIHWSPRKSLETHLPFKTVLSFDLSSAFANCRFEHVEEFYRKRLTHLDYTTGEEIAKFLATISTTTYDAEKRGIPQGTPHGVPLFNRVLYELDCRLHEVAQQRGLVYTRWVDDMMISSVRGEPLEYLVGAVDIVRRKFPIAKSKLFFQDSKDPVYLLGQVAERGRIFKNSKQDRENNKKGRISYEEWFGSSARRHDTWER